MMPRKIDLQIFIDEIYQDSKTNPDSNYVFFLGAGCSKSSGIPLADELAKRWYDRLKDSQKPKFDAFNTKHKITPKTNIDYGKLYFNIFEEYFPDIQAQQKEIQSIVEDDTVNPSFGYYTLASLLQKPAFNTIITTNFDDLIQDALIYSGHKRALVITHQDLAKFVVRNNTPLISKIHGDAHMHPFNSSRNTKEIPSTLKDAIQGLLNNSKLIFIGYRGDDDSIFSLLSSCSRISQVYWLNSEPPSDVKLSSWWKKLETKTWVDEYNFDKIMLAMRDKFELKEPDFKTRAIELENKYKASISQESEKLEEEKEKTAYDYLLLGNSFYYENKYDEAIKAYKEAIKINPQDDNAYHEIGISYASMEKHDKAIDAYIAAIKINPKDYSTYYNLGISYSNLKKYDKAIEVYKVSIKINPKYDSAYTNLFELQLIQNQLFEKEIETKYIELFKEKKEIFIKYEMLKILQDISLNKKVNVKKWEEKYFDIPLNDWSFDELHEWVSKIKEEKIRTNLEQALTVFEVH